MPAGLPPLDVDPILIEQLLLNLLKNAIDAMDKAAVRRIDLVVRRVDDMAEFSVIDHGTGIPPELRPNLFQPFFSTKSEGMGMGLNICRSIVEFHQGRLLLEENPEGGTIFRFTLPLAACRQASTKMRASRREADVTDSAETLGVVYVVDDDDAVRDSLQWLLEASRYRVIGFDSAEKFLAESRSRRDRGGDPRCAHARHERPGTAGRADRARRA